MKKLNLTLISFLAFINALYADSSNRFAVFFLGGGVNGIANISKVTELMPVDYSNIAQTFPNFNSSSNIINQMCKSGTCDLNSLGGGLSVEAGVKLRPSSFLEFDLWIGFDYSFMLGSDVYPNAIKLKDNFGYDYQNTYKDGEFPSVWSDLMHLSLNATATFRVKRFGFTGGIGGGMWGNSYNITLKKKDIFDDKEKTERTGGTSGGSLNLILGLSYAWDNMWGENRKGEIAVRFVMPLTEMVHEESGNNGYVDYKERITVRPYMINIISRYYF
ncbi:hypothetical protein CQA66_07890 [Helicobacter aurati]|uniref:Outer membrane beta-barrel protein n=1 Tax=Helicobacter aurati TaxID=137778 RepID=A0A3D8J084_9HELI|nr:hypothetical protein [Helicobacter aurati]RDU70626.1 hypothetical protein CQA66_07890 [Helicobacter aurati]